jgi:hypothetical protein
LDRVECTDLGPLSTYRRAPKNSPSNVALAALSTPPTTLHR